MFNSPYPRQALVKFLNESEPTVLILPKIHTSPLRRLM